MNKFQNIEDFTDKQKEEFYKRIGSNVARIRKKHKLSQLKLSLLIGHKSTSLLAGAGVLEIPCQSDKIISRIDNGTRYKL